MGTLVVKRLRKLKKNFGIIWILIIINLTDSDNEVSDEEADSYESSNKI